jgi:ATP-binding cassette subfamily B protein/subfamily B ATP-binding cassette protein MsbA
MMRLEVSVNRQPIRSQPSNVGLTKLYLWVLSYVWPHKRVFIGLIVCNLFISLIEMAIPKLIQYFIDVLLPSHNEKLYYSLLGATALIVAFMFVLAAARNNLQRDVQELAGRDLQFDVYRKLHQLGYAHYERHPVGETLSLLNTDVTAVQQIYQSYLPKLIQQALFVSVMTTVMFMTQWKLSLAVIPCFLLFYLFAPYLTRKTTAFGRQRSENGKLMNKRMYDSLMALPEVRANGGEKWDLNRLLETVSAYNQSDVKSNYFALVRGSLRSLSISLGAVVLFLYGSQLVQSGALTVGEFIAFLFYYFMTIGMFSFIIMSLATQKAILFQAEAVYHFMRRTPEVYEHKHPVSLTSVQGELRFSNVQFDYPERTGILKHFDLHIRPGEKVAIVGQSGIGKSTVLKLIGRFYDPTEGEIELDGVPIRKLSLSELRGAIGFVFQETYLFNESVRENIRFGRPGATDEEVEAAAAAAYAHDFIMQMPERYDTMVGERGSSMSGGQKQRIAIARMIIKNPAVILLDEATSALDGASETEVGLALEKLFQGRTIVAVAHRVSTIRQFERIVLIADGQVAESGSYDELMSRKRLFYRLVNGRSEELE